MAKLIKKSEREMLAKIEGVIFEEYLVMPSELHSISREHRVAHARFIVWHILRKRLNWAFLDIAECFKRDHSTIVHGIESVYKLGLDSDEVNIWLTVSRIIKKQQIQAPTK